MENINSSDPTSGISNSNSDHKMRCQCCEKILSSRQNLREHSCVHTGEMPYLCLEHGCNKKFRQGSLLSIHKKIHLEVQRKLGIIDSVAEASFPKLTRLLNQNKPEKNNECEDLVFLKTKIGENLFSFIEEFL